MFILSFGLILLVGYIVGYLLNKIKIPGLVGMIIVGLVFGPYCLNLIDENILNISSELRQIALVIILTRSGLNLNIQSLKKVGRPAILMCFIPATLEIVGIMLASHFILNLSWQEGLLLGSVLAAVSPAVVSPRMIKLIEEGYGKEHSVPELILAGSSVDDIYVIVLFYAFLSLVETNTFNFISIALAPISIILGIIFGIVVGIILLFIFKKTKFSLPINILILISTSFLMIGVENLLKPYISISSLLGIMVIGMILTFKLKDKAKELSRGYNSMWTFFEVILFVLVGASVNFSYALNNFWPSLLVLIIGLLSRTIGVIICLLFTKLTIKERIFCIFAYLPKATVQASIGGIALSTGLSCGEVILTVSVLSIIITAPLGAFFIDIFAKKLLKKT
ncbi:MAG: cation:proton antiporter [Bacilli bacterium]